MVTGVPSKRGDAQARGRHAHRGDWAPSVQVGSGLPVTWTGRVWARVASDPSPPLRPVTRTATTASTAMKARTIPTGGTRRPAWLPRPVGRAAAGGVA